MANGNLTTGLGGGLSLGPSGQNRLQVARALQAQSLSGQPISSPFQVAGRIAQALAGKNIASDIQQQQQQRQQRLAETLRGAVQAGQPFEDQIEPGTGQRVAPARQRIAEVLMGNRDTAAVGANVGLARALSAPEATTQTLPGSTVNQALGTNFGPDAAVTVERSPQGGITVKDVFETETPSGNAVNVLLPGEETPVSGIEDEQGRLFIRNERGERVRAPREARKVGLNVNAATTEDLGSTEAREMNDAEVAAKNFVRTTEDALNLLAENPDVNTMVAKSAALVNDLKAEASAFGRMFGDDMYEGDMETLLSPDNYTSAFDELGIENRRMRSLITSLGFQLARSREPGRLSDNEVRLAINDIGGSTGDPRAFAQTLRDVAQRVGRRFQINFETRMDRPYEGDLGLSRLQPESAPGAGEFKVLGFE